VEDIGKQKAEVAAGKLKNQNPFVEFIILKEKICAKNVLEIVKEFDVVVDGTDNFSTRYLVNDACVIAKKTLVFGSIFKFEGQLTVFNYNSGPTYRCLYPERPEEAMSCSEAGVIGVLPGIIGCLQANEVLKIITGIGEVLSGKLMVFNALTSSFSIFQFSADPENLKVSSIKEADEIISCTDNEIDPEELLSVGLKDENFLIYDLRESYEKNENENFKFPVVSFDFSEIASKAASIEKNKTIIFMCKKGLRSKSAVGFLIRNHRFEKIYTLKGGADALFEYLKKS
jgi:sulfur-carrier protein adenylyltransferase/sulfurtransferase